MQNTEAHFTISKNKLSYNVAKGTSTGVKFSESSQKFGGPFDRIFDLLLQRPQQHLDRLPTLLRWPLRIVDHRMKASCWL